MNQAPVVNRHQRRELERRGDPTQHVLAAIAELRELGALADLRFAQPDPSAKLLGLYRVVERFLRDYVTFVEMAEAESSVERSRPLQWLYVDEARDLAIKMRALIEGQSHG